MEKGKRISLLQLVLHCFIRQYGFPVMLLHVSMAYAQLLTFLCLFISPSFHSSIDSAFTKHKPTTGSPERIEHSSKAPNLRYVAQGSDVNSCTLQ
jgi:hypothetical protein